MKIRILFVISLVSLSISYSAQSKKEKAYSKALEAIKMMDQGKYEESIEILEECSKLDPENYVYPYEIGYAYVLLEDYKKALKICQKLKKYESINSQIYQMSGNCYSYMGKPELAIKEYEEGMKVFPNSGNLHLEKGNIYLDQKNYNEAVKNYEMGIEVDPTFASNYYRLAKLFLNSTDKLSGLIYGEIFMNLERTTGRTQEMSELLYQTYRSSIIFNGDQTELDFCEIIIDGSKIIEDEIKLPLCAAFGKDFALAAINQDTLNLNSLSSIRIKFIEIFFEEDSQSYPNVLFQYQKEMYDKGYLDAYNHYLFQIGAQSEFDSWLKENREKYDQFVEWYVQNGNVINVNSENKFIR